ncbi:FAD dependent oxidoreductase [Halteromyces radiatus]|uniref:FAD dependent oxidoreductase n=1 Tax=Halteromyces radiatus TaxID=101107 RepID=UPI00221EBA15|nr:FAD dependent oxidoreductase [Halteromyces radiatus]KAI8088965.1 FAD dependent oxidoreductase [Halteromyces radiatus]
MPKVIIVGGGCFGLSTAYALSLKSEYEVWVFDRQSIPSPDAASTDINKIMRFDYGDDITYMHLMMEALPYWHQYNKERAEQGESPVFHETGVLMMSRHGEYSDFEKKSLRNIRQAGYGHCIEELDGEAIIKRYPQFKTAVHHGFNIAYLNKAGGWCNSAEAVKHMHQKCLQQGVRFVIGGDQGTLSSLYCPNNNKTEGIVTMDGKIHKADKVVLATGSWTPGVVEMENQIIATGQAVIQFKPYGDLRDQFDQNCPVWCADLSKTGFYGFPINADGKMKIGIHNSGYLWPRKHDNVSIPRTQVAFECDTIPLSALREFRRFLANFIPGTSCMDIAYSRLCWYCDSIDGDFLISQHPKYSNLIIAAGDSGHGMKFLPNIGFQVRNVIEDISTDYTRKWAWRNMDVANTKLDGLRQGSAVNRGILLGHDENMRFASPDELTAATAHL